MTQEKITAKNLIVLVDLSNGKIHQVLLSKQISDIVMSAIKNTTGGLKVSETHIEGIEIK